MLYLFIAPLALVPLAVVFAMSYTLGTGAARCPCPTNVRF
jgi:hypothetical protein